jgi:CheY-like chemotaxis protein
VILVADDSPAIQRRAQGILQGEGFEVETVSNGVAAIKKLPKLQPILVLADVSMPGKDGYEVCEFVKSSADFCHVPVLLVGSDLEPYDEQRGAQVGADGIIKKPFTPHDLIALVAKFTGLGGAQASQSTLTDTLVASSPAALPEVPPMGSEPELSARSQGQDSAALGAGVAFAGLPLDEVPATPAKPLPDVSVQPSPEPGLQVSPQSLPEPRLAAPPEDVLGGSSEPLLAPTEPFPGFAFGLAPELTPERIPEAAPEPVWVSPELISETALEAGSEQVSVVSESVAESGLTFTPEAATETAHLPAEAAAEAPPAVPVEEVPLPTEPILGEKQVEPIPSLSPSPDQVTPEADRTVAFRVPAEIAEPALVDELTPAPPAPERPPLVEGQRRKPMAATHLDSFSLAEAAEGQVYVAPPETEVGPTPEPKVAQPGGAAAGAPSVVDPEWVHIVVHKVVMKMAPPVLPPELVEELIRILTREITAELGAASSQVY